MKTVLELELSPEDIEHFKIGGLNAKLPTDRDQTLVFRNQKWQ